MYRLNIDNYYDQLLSNYLDSEETVEDFKGNKVLLDDAMRYKQDYFLRDDATEFLDWLGFTPLQILEEMGAE